MPIDVTPPAYGIPASLCFPGYSALYQIMTQPWRDYPLTETLEVDNQGWITLLDQPDLGTELSEARLAESLKKSAIFY